MTIQSVLQPWVTELPLMQQTVLLTAIRGPDGTPKYGNVKMLLRWYRRCVLFSAMDRTILGNPYSDNGGSFTGPSISKTLLGNKVHDKLQEQEGPNNAYFEGCTPWDRVQRMDLNELAGFAEEHLGGWEALMDEVVGNYLRELDALPHHFQLHFLHAAQILGYKHEEPRIRNWWRKTYERLVHDMHLWPETEEQMDARLGDNREQWLARNDPATVE